MSEFTIKDKVAIAGLGETKYYKRGDAPVSEFRLALEAIQRAADDAGMPVTAIDGIASYSNDRNDSVRVATALGLPELRFTNMFWGGGGGGGSGAIGNAAAAIVAGFATCVVVYRALAQGQFGRFGATPGDAHDFRAYRVHLAVRDVHAGAMDRAAHAPLHARSSRHAGRARGDRDGLLSPRAVQSARDHVRPPADAAGLRRVAMDRRAVSSLRLLSRERRRRRRDSSPAPSGRAISSRSPRT